MHGGDNRSTSFSIQDGGDRVLWKCFAGCPSDAILEELQSRGLLPKRGAGPVRLAPQMSRDAIEMAYYSMALALSDIRAGRGVAERERADEMAGVIRLYKGRMPDALVSVGWQEEVLQLTAMSLLGITL